jgi:RNA polymerase sigma-70 factor (sigma-E family)
MRQADEDRFREFARSQALLLRRCAYLLCGDWHLAEDLVQATLVKLYGAWPRIENTDRPVSYARTTLTRCWLDERRRPWRRAEERSGDLPDTADSTVDPALAHDRSAVREELLAALAGLPPRQRAVLVLRYFGGMSITATAVALGCSEGTVKSQASRGLDTLRSRFVSAEFALFEGGGS